MDKNKLQSTVMKLFVVATALSIGAFSVNSGCKATKQIWKSDDMSMFEKFWATGKIWGS